MTATAPAKGGESLARSIPIHPFLFAVYPLLFLYSNNLTDVSLEDVVGPLIVVLGGTALAFGILALLFRSPARAAIVVTAVIIPLLLFTRILRLVPAFLPVNRIILLGICGVVVALAVVAAVRLRDRLGTVTLVLNAVGVVLVVLTLVPIGQSLAQSSGDETATTTASTVVTGPGSATDRDIWYLIFDRYGSEASLATEYGITQNDLVPWLREQGFQVIDDARANYVRTGLSLASTLNMTHLDTLTEQLGPDSHDYGPINRMLRASEVARILKGRGYEYYNIGSWFEPTRSSKLADVNLDPDSVVSFATTVYDLSLLPFVTRKLGLREPHSWPMKHANAAFFDFDHLEALVDAPGPKFIFGHVLMPHPPLVFLADGTVAPGKATYETQMEYTNSRIEELVTKLMALPEEERPIIVLQADEGPYPARYARQKDAFDWSKATADELEMKYGILDAMYLPGPQGEAPVDPRTTSVNTFRTLFRRYFGADLPDLPDRSYASSKSRPYDLLDITDKLPPTGAAAAASPVPAGSPGASPAPGG